MLQHRGAERARAGRAAAVVDVEPVRLATDPHHLGAQLPQRGRRPPVGGAVRAVHHDAQALQTSAAREARLAAFHVAAGGVVQPRGTADHVGSRQPVAEVGRHQRLDLGLRLVGQLEPVRPEQLDAVVLERVVRGRDHDAEVGPQAARQQGHRRRRQRPHQRHVDAGGQEAGHQRAFDHVAGQPRVLAQHHAVPMAAAPEPQAGRLTQPLRDLDGHRRGVGGAPDPIRPEQRPGSTHHPHPSESMNPCSSSAMHRLPNAQRLHGGGDVMHSQDAAGQGQRRQRSGQ